MLHPCSHGRRCPTQDGQRRRQGFRPARFCRWLFRLPAAGFRRRAAPPAPASSRAGSTPSCCRVSRRSDICTNTSILPVVWHKPAVQLYHSTIVGICVGGTWRKNSKERRPQTGTASLHEERRNGKTLKLCRKTALDQALSRPDICLTAFMAKVRVRPMATPAIRQG